MCTFVILSVSRCLTFPALPEVVLTRGQFQFLPSGQYGLCFGYCFSGPLTLCSHHGQVTLRGACFQESLVIRLKLSVASPIYPWVTATRTTKWCPKGTISVPSVFLSVLRFCQKQYQPKAVMSITLPFEKNMQWGKPH